MFVVVVVVEYSSSILTLRQNGILSCLCIIQVLKIVSTETGIIPKYVCSVSANQVTLCLLDITVKPKLNINNRNLPSPALPLQEISD